MKKNLLSIILMALAIILPTKSWAQEPNVVIPRSDKYYIMGEINEWANENIIKTMFYREGRNGNFTYTTKWNAREEMAPDLILWDTRSIGVWNWDYAWGIASDGEPSAALNGTLSPNTGSNHLQVPERDIFYTLSFNMKDKTYQWTRLENQQPTEYQSLSMTYMMDGNPTEVDMTQVTPHNWYVQHTIPNSNGYSSSQRVLFRANHDNAVTWGGGNSSYYYTQTSVGGDSTRIVYAGHIFDIYFNDITGQANFVPTNEFSVLTDENVEITLRQEGNESCSLRGGYDYSYAPCVIDDTEGPITIPNEANGLKVTSIPGYAFTRCNLLTNISIPESVSRISNYAFSGCSSITEMYLPPTVTSMGDGMFSKCSSLERIVVADDNPNYDSRNNCNAVMRKSDNKLLAGCKNTIIPEETTGFGYDAFYGMTMTELTIPENVVDYGFEAFEECNNLMRITVLRQEPATIGQSMFSRQAYQNATLYVPAGTVEAYRNAEGWNKFQKIREIGDDIVVSLVNNGDMEGTDVSSFFVKINAGETVPATITNGVGVNESRGIKVEATAMKEEAWDNQFWIRLNQPVSDGTKFRISYDYRADKEGRVQTEAHEEPGTYINMTYHGNRYDDVRYFSTEWQTSSYEGTMSSENSSDQHPMQSIAFSLNHFEEANNYYFDNIVFEVYLEDQCPKPTFKQTENSVSIQSPFDATIYYTLDGSEPTTNSAHAAGTVVLNFSKETSIKAIAVVEGYEVSPVATYLFEPTENNLDQRREELMDMIHRLAAEDSECRQLLDMMEDADPQWMDSMIKRLDQVEYGIKEVRDQTEAATSNEELDECQDRIYKIANELGMIRQEIDSYAPKPITAGFDGLTAWVSDNASLDDAFVATGGRETAAQTIAAIIWNCQYPLTADMLQGINNPNLLVYVTDASLAPQGVQNVVVNGQAREIILTDATSGNNNFFCPEPFMAEKISYTRNFRQHTVIGTSRGWEGLALPFAVQTITHETQGRIAPFRNDGSNKHFWLRQMRDNGLTSAQRIEPNVPYLIAMPNSSEYYNEYNLSGRVTFEAENVEVYPTEEYGYGSNEIHLISNFTRKTTSEEVYALNVGDAREGWAEGSVFIRNYREVRPFEVYTIHRANGARPRFIAVNSQTNNEATGINDIEIDAAEGTWYSLDGRQMQGEPQRKGIYLQKGGKKVVVK